MFAAPFPIYISLDNASFKRTLHVYQILSLMWAKLPQEPDEMVILGWNLAKLVTFVLTEKQKNHISVCLCVSTSRKKFGIAIVLFRVITDDGTHNGTKGEGVCVITVREQL
jgi:hypothetical protein